VYEAIQAHQALHCRTAAHCRPSTRSALCGFCHFRPRGCFDTLLLGPWSWAASGPPCRL